MALNFGLHSALQGSASVRCSRSTANLNSSHSRTFQRRCQTIVPGPDNAALLIHAPKHTRSNPCAASRDSQLIVNDTATPPSSSTGRSKAQTHAGKSAVRSRTARGRFSNRNTRNERNSTQDLESVTRRPPPESVAWYEQPIAPAAPAPAAAISPPKQVSSSSISGLTTQLEGHSPHQHQQQSTSSNQASDASSSSSSGSSSSRGNKLTAELSTNLVQQLQQYLSHMLETNKSMNLTAIRDPDEAWQRHIEDSLALLPVIAKYSSSSSSSSSSHSPAAAASATPVVDRGSTSTRRRNHRSTVAAAAATAGHADAEDPVQQEPNHQQQQQQQQQLSVIDVGTGAGLPGMVFAIARPHWKVTLLDSRRKRCEFLQATADMLGLNNVTVVWSRAEDGARRADLREAHDLAVARAVAELRVLSELCLPFVKHGGLWVAAKGANPEDEVSAAHNAMVELGGNLLAVERVESWSLDGQRTAVVVTKSSNTPRRFPRSPGQPGRKPL